MFLLLPLDAVEPCVSLKCSTDYVEDLRERYTAVEGAWHFNKKYWNQVFLDRDLDDKLIKQLIDHSYDEVIKKFPQKLRAKYDALP